MGRTVYKHTRISNIATVVPRRKESIDDDIELFHTKKAIEKIKSITDLGERRIAEKDTTSLDLCYRAAISIFETYKINKEEIDGVIFVTQTPDYRIPNSASVVHGMLGLEDDCLCYDINHGCAGYIYGLLNASALIETGMCKKVLLLVGDTLSKVINPKDKSLKIIHGDAGSATIVEYSENENNSVFEIHSRGDKSGVITIKAGGYRNESSDETKIEKLDSDGNWRSDEQLYMNGLEVFNFALDKVPQLIQDILCFSGCDVDEIDFYAFHQANGLINKGIISKLGINKEKAPWNVVKKYGNSSCASIPQVLCEEVSNNQTEKKKVLMTGFGVGLSWGCCLADLSGTNILPIISM